MTELNQTHHAGRAEAEAGDPLLVQKDGLPRLSSRVLFQAAREIIIEHDGADYRLRLTANGKLILTK
ncbi:hemin uptake protein HemP [Ferrovibrio sp.]|uniref:hemin uptake protein HemP n=1 Tax=Ferrovibrio sp. TaxID=1917215 RepID=UPI0035B4F709